MRRVVLFSALLSAASFCAVGQVALPTDSIGPYPVHSIAGGPEIVQPLPGGFEISQDHWSLWAWVRTAAATQSAAIAGFGDPAPGRHRALMLVRGVPALTFGADDAALSADHEMPNGWHMLAATQDGAIASLYVDGVLVASRQVQPANAKSQILLSPIAKERENSAFSGDYAFYVAKHSLTAKEIRSLFESRPDLSGLTFEENSRSWPLQTRQEAGYTRPQAPEDMPHGAAPQLPHAQPLPPPAPTLHPVAADTWELVANWKLLVNDGPAPLRASDGMRVSRARFDDTNWLRATVPGTVLTTLIDRGVYPDPDFGLNNLAIPESLNKHDDWYRVTFAAPHLKPGRRFTLCFGGVSYAAEFWMNGSRLGEVTGAFKRATFDVTALLRASDDNVVAVRILPPPHPGIPQEQSIKGGPGWNGGAMVTDGPGFMDTEGWDWIPAIRDRDMGLWQGVTLHETGAVTLDDAQIITRLPLPDTSSANVEIHLPVYNSRSRTERMRAVVSFEGVSISTTAMVRPGDSTIDLLPTTFSQLHIAHPRLWWPNGYGDPALYHATIQLLDSAGVVTDTRMLTFGIRQVTYELSLFDASGAVRRVEVDPTDARTLPNGAVDVRHEAIRQRPSGWAYSIAQGAEGTPAVRPITNEPGMTDLVLKVNGVRIAARGGNWGMDDSRKRISREHLEPYFRLHREANLNIIRNWQGQNTEDIFYQLADEYGLMVWNDFWMSTQNSNAEPGDPQVLLVNARDAVRRYRNHPSIVVWCGRNEGVPPPTVNLGLIDIFRAEDGTRFYAPSSNRINLRDSGPYMWKSPDLYYSTLDKGFAVELGTASFPTLEAFRAMTSPADQWPLSDAWAYHDWHQSSNGDVHGFMQHMETQLGASKSLEEFERHAQMFNYVDHKAIFEGLYQHLWAPNSGRLLWMTHPAWPSTYWQIYSFDYDTHAAYFGVKKANEPLHVQMDMSTGDVTIVNTTRAAHPELQARVRVVDLENHSLLDKTLPGAVSANSIAGVTALPLQELFDKASMLLVRLSLQDSAGHELSNNFYWLARHEEDFRALNSLSPPELHWTATRVESNTDDAAIAVHVTNAGTSAALELKFTLVNAAGERILPAYWSDNYISLLPGEQREIFVRFPRQATPPSRLELRGWNTPAQTIAVERP